MNNGFRSLILTAVLLFSCSTQSWAAGIMLSPLRIDFKDKDRYASVTVMNDDKNNPVRYHIRMDPLRMNTDGKMEQPAQPDAREKLAMRLVRYSPSTAVIPAGGKQVVRLMLKKPTNLPEGEYMTYFSVEPEPIKNSNIKSPEKQNETNLTLLVGVRIPLVIRHGKVFATDSVESVKFYEAKNKEVFAQVTTSHAGNKSSIIGVRLEQILPSGEELSIGSSNRNVIYLPLTERRIRIPIKNPDTLYKRGKVRVTIFDKENDSKILSQKEFGI